MQLPFGMSNASLAAVAASYDAENQLAQRIRRISPSETTCGCG